MAMMLRPAAMASGGACSAKRECRTSGLTLGRHRKSQQGQQHRRIAPAMNARPSIQFVKGLDETVVPNVRLTRARDGSSGTAYFSFDNPSVFDATGEMGEITGLFLVDEEGEMASTDVQAKFVNGRPSTIEAKLLLKTPMEWDRFLRFMERYADENDLGFKEAKK